MRRPARWARPSPRRFSRWVLHSLCKLKAQQADHRLEHGACSLDQVGSLQLQLLVRQLRYVGFLAELVKSLTDLVGVKAQKRRVELLARSGNALSAPHSRDKQVMCDSI